MKVSSVIPLEAISCSFLGRHLVIAFNQGDGFFI
jgi:hypothetical protein